MVRDIFHPTLDETPMTRIQVMIDGSRFPSYYSNDWWFTFTMDFQWLEPWKWSEGRGLNQLGKFQWTDAAAGRCLFCLSYLVKPSWGWFAGLPWFTPKKTCLKVTSFLWDDLYGMISKWLVRIFIIFFATGNRNIMKYRELPQSSSWKKPSGHQTLLAGNHHLYPFIDRNFPASHVWWHRRVSKQMCAPQSPQGGAPKCWCLVIIPYKAL